MRIGGLQKLSLLDYPGKLCCTVFTSGCNFRCPFCHNRSLIDGGEESVHIDELISFLKKRQNILQGVCITGGEPLLHNDIEELIRSIKNLGYNVKLDTNGSFPDKLEQLVGSGLIDYVAMDIKNSPRKYALTSGLDILDFVLIEKSIKFLMSGKVPYEFRTTVVRELHSYEDMTELAQIITGADKYFLQAYVDSENVLKRGFSAYSEAEMLEIKRLVRELVPSAEIRGQ